MIKIPARRRTLLIGLALVLLIASIYPRKSTFAAEYEVTVADTTGRGLPGVIVRRYIQDYSSGGNIDHSSHRKNAVCNRERQGVMVAEACRAKSRLDLVYGQLHLWRWVCPFPWSPK